MSRLISATCAAVVVGLVVVPALVLAFVAVESVGLAANLNDIGAMTSAIGLGVAGLSRCRG